MSQTPTQIEGAQAALCRERGAAFVAADSDSILGLAKSTEGLLPVNGLRHSLTAGTSGWYIWFGEDFSMASDFFAPVHVRHVYSDHPELASLLGLPPGFRFLLAGEHLDIWFDPSLLDV
jgi:hypothetical protein